VVLALAIIGLTGFEFTRIATGFLPVEDQGYLIATAQLPDGASLERTQKVLDQISDIAHKTPGVAQVVTIAGISALDNSATLANAGIAYVILKDWSQRGAGQDLLSLYTGLNRSLDAITEARSLVLPPPPIQGIGNAFGATMQLELRDNSFDLAKLQAAVDAMVANGGTQSSVQRIQTSYRSGVPQYTVAVDRVKAETVHVSVSTSSTNSAACFRSMCKPIPASGCGSRTSPISRCATATATWSRSAPSSPSRRRSGRR
jgi:HAE1 family hydrophobic/amphiphilic exporter-1